MKVSVLIKDAFSGEIIRNNEVTTEEYSFQQMSQFHEQFKRKYPNAFINFSWLPKGGKQNSFIYGMPLNQEIDELLLDKELMTFEEYETKWYAAKVA